MWQVWIDTGGTFTDCLAVDPAGALHRAKVLSSGALRGRVVRMIDDRTLEVAPRYFDAAIGAGETAYRLGRDDDAVRFFERARAINPDVSRVRRRLGELYLKRGDRKSAIEEWKRSLELNPNQPELRRMLGELGS